MRYKYALKRPPPRACKSWSENTREKKGKASKYKGWKVILKFGENRGFPKNFN